MRYWTTADLDEDESRQWRPEFDLAFDIAITKETMMAALDDPFDFDAFKKSLTERKREGGSRYEARLLRKALIGPKYVL